jgi:hypothetical protein
MQMLKSCVWIIMHMNAAHIPVNGMIPVAIPAIDDANI